MVGNVLEGEFGTLPAIEISSNCGSCGLFAVNGQTLMRRSLPRLTSGVQIQFGRPSALSVSRQRGSQGAEYMLNVL